MEIYNKLSDHAKRLIDDYFEPCGLKNSILVEIRDIKLAKTNIKYGSTIISQSKDKIGSNSDIIWAGLKQIVNSAISLAERYDKDICHYIKIAVEDKRLTKYVLNYIAAYTRKQPDYFP